MGTETELITEIQTGNMVAAQQFVERYASPLFRYCRMYFNDHYRAGEFIEEYLGMFLQRLRRHDTVSYSVESFFTEALLLSQRRKLDSEPGKGLSKKQRRIIELMSDLPLMDRLILDLVCLEGHSHETVSQWFEISVDRIEKIESSFHEILMSDETIKEFLINAATQQAKQEKARLKARDKSDRKGVQKHDSKSVPKTSRRIFSDRELSGPQTLTKWSAPEPSQKDAGKTDGTDTAGSNENAEECKKPRPRRRRVDPRKLNIEI